MGGFSFRREFLIEWGHCDPAGIVFNSRFFEFFDWNTWLLFEAALGVRPGDLAKTFGIMGIPLVDAKGRFLKPAKFNDLAEIVSEVADSAARASRCAIASRSAGKLRLRAARRGYGQRATPLIRRSSGASRSRPR